jgi:hypothetical protein
VSGACPLMLVLGDPLQVKGLAPSGSSEAFTVHSSCGCVEEVVVLIFSPLDSAGAILPKRKVTEVSLLETSFQSYLEVFLQGLR